MVLTTRNEVKNQGGYQMEREFLTRFLLVTTRFLAVLTTRNEVKNQGGVSDGKRLPDEVPPGNHEIPPGNHEIPHGAHHEE